MRCRRYGTPGQSQHGIDLAGRKPDRTYVVVQCKEEAACSARALREAVGTFTGGRRPFDATHFIIAVSASTAATQVQDG